MLKFIYFAIFIVLIIVIIIYITMKSRQGILEILTIKEFIHRNDIDSPKNYAIEEDNSFIDLINDFFDGKKDGDNVHDQDDDDGDIGDGGDDGGD